MSQIAGMEPAAKSSKKIKTDSASQKQDLPPYLKMVTEAITTLKKKGGSSRQAIVKFIGEKYNIENVSNVFVGKALKRGVESGTIVQDKQSFKIVKQGAADGQATPKAKSTKKSDGAVKTLKPVATKPKSPKSSVSKVNKKASVAKKPPTPKTSKTAAKSPVTKKGLPDKASEIVKASKSPIAKKGRPVKATPLKATKTTPSKAAKSPAGKKGRAAKTTTVTKTAKAGQSPAQKKGRPTKAATQNA